MRIDSSKIGMESERRYTSQAGRVSKVTITDGTQKLADGTGGLSGNLFGSDVGEETTQTQEKEKQGDYADNLWKDMQAKLERYSSKSIRGLRETQSRIYDIKRQSLNYLLDILFPVRRGLLGESSQSTSSSGSTGASSVTGGIFSSMGANVRTFSFSREYFYEETEMTSFTTKGTVKCADGREISFDLNLNMSRSFQEYYKESYDMVQVSMCDPLVINLDGNIAELSDQTFFFDIDGDGEKDEINRLAAGSGYLALDKNGDGLINDGTELFGTASGNGFADLAAYDSDGNGFIDEGDEIWSRLKIWTMDESGKEQLCSLSEKGVGAICLSNVSTDFSLTGADNAAKGMIRNTGFFLYENGAAGSIQHVDVAKYDQAG